MATTTTRLGLTKPDFVDVVDISQLNANADKIDVAVGATVCTSTTRPSTPFTGRIIYETDTDKILVWTGSAWEETGASTLNDLTDVTITGTTANRVLRYNGSQWVNGQVTTNDITNAAVTSAKLGPGTVLQVVSATKTTAFTTTTSGYQDVPDLQVTVTPRSSSSNFLVLVAGYISTSETPSSYNPSARVTRTVSAVTTNLPDWTGFTANATRIGYPTSVALLDSPSAGAAATYKVQLNRTSGTAYWGRSTSDSSALASYITVMEIAG